MARLTVSIPTLLTGTGALLACSGLPELPIGQLELGLASGIGETRYRLQNAEFAIDGAAQLSLNTEDEPDSDILQRALPAGDYSVELLPGWQLERSGPLGTEPVAAELASGNPLDFSIAAGELTALTFQFRTRAGEEAMPRDGQLQLGIEVDGVGAPRVVITEFMRNPEILPDAEGEWFELYNAGTAPMDLGGCTFARDDQELPLEAGFTIPAGGHWTFANGETPGFPADVLYRGITLPNTGSFVLTLSCGEQLIDRVALDAGALPNRAGRSLSLSRTALDGTANDRAENWCEAVSSYNGDFGTPGQANPTCAP